MFGIFLPVFLNLESSTPITIYPLSKYGRLCSKIGLKSASGRHFNKEKNLYIALGFSSNLPVAMETLLRVFFNPKPPMMAQAYLQALLNDFFRTKMWTP